METFNIRIDRDIEMRGVYYPDENQTMPEYHDVLIPKLVCNVEYENELIRLTDSQYIRLDYLLHTHGQGAFLVAANAIYMEYRQFKHDSIDCSSPDELDDLPF